MPVPGPRTQHGPLPGYTNPEGETPHRFNMWGRPAPVAQMGHTPALTFINIRGNILGAGQIRRMWRQAVNQINAPAPYSWSESAPRPDQPSIPTGAVGITRALRYMTRSFYTGSGIDYTHFSGLHTTITPRVRSKPVTIGAGQTRTRPTTRNRITSFGSRVPPINPPIQAAQPDPTP